MSLVRAVSRSAVHGFSKEVVAEVRLIAGLGVEGDVHAGVTAQHRYTARKRPGSANLCQVHLLQEELFASLLKVDIRVGPGEMGENVTTGGVDLLGLPIGALLRLGAEAVVEITGLREPCVLMDRFRTGLMQACLGRDALGGKVRKAGVMGIVLVGGVVRAGDEVTVEMPVGAWRRMGPV